MYTEYTRGPLSDKDSFIALGILDECCTWPGGKGQCPIGQHIVAIK